MNHRDEPDPPEFPHAKSKPRSSAGFAGATEGGGSEGRADAPEGAVEAPFDKITRAVVWAALRSIAEEAGTALRKTAYSQAVREGRDFSVALFDPRGQMIAQGDFSPGHLGSMPSLVGHVLREYPPDALAPGDAIVLNDLYMGSGHLPDFFMTTPVFHRGRLVGFAVNCAHQVDVGGAAAGSQAVEGITEFYQEGIRILPTKLWRAGEVNREVMRIIKGNVRLPEIVEGDLKAMRSSGRVAEVRLVELFDRYGADIVLATWDEILAHSEREMRAAIRTVPAGRYEAEDFYDDCGRGTDPLRVFVTVIVDGDEITVDFTGSSDQTASGINSPFNYTLAYTWHTVKSALVQSSIPQNAGTMRPIRAYAPEGSLFNPRPPAAAGARAVMQQRIVDVILQALAHAVPDRVIASSSHWANPIFEGRDPARGRRFVYYDIIVGGMGARPHTDGAEAVCGSFNLENIPVEVNESNYPIVVERLELIRDSSGPGRFRGSSGLRKDIRFLGERGKLSNLSDRHRFAPPGLFGGEPGALGRTVLNPGTPREQVLHPKAIYPIERGDLVSLSVSGSGGYGDPLDRDPELVARDVALGHVSVERAREAYGVVVDATTCRADAEATAALRARRRATAANDKETCR
ncbi:MAG: hydantoinase B/oxoprolinase family protein [Candidatus Rokubacteria bacterium]|nr:hydantoinase B/oxoprolinase family protein [Candidatus Rokubacteria bacterium]